MCRIWQHRVEGRLRLTFNLMNSSVMTLKKIFSPFSCRLRMKCSSNTDIDWFYIAWNAWHASRFCLPALPSTFKGVSYLNSYISDHFETARQENGADVSQCLHNVTSVTSNVTLRFAPLATGPNFGSSYFIGSLRGQSEMTLNGMSSDPHNGVNSLDLILATLGTQRMLMHEKTCLIPIMVPCFIQQI